MKKNDPYRKVAKWYDKLFEPVNAGLISLGLKIFQPAKGMTVLDVGCGTGMQLARYQKAGCHIFGIDPSAAMLRVARRKLGDGVKLHLGDAANMPFENDKFDLVTATLVLHEMSPASRDAVINDIKRVLKNGGRILFIDFHPGKLQPPKGWFTKIFITVSEIGAGREHYRNYRDFMARKGLPSLISKHGFAVKEHKIVSGGNMGLFLLAMP